MPQGQTTEIHPEARYPNTSRRGIAGGQLTLDSDKSKRQVNFFWLLLRKVLTYRNFAGKICSDSMSGIRLQWHLRSCVGSFDLTVPKAFSEILAAKFCSVKCFNFIFCFCKSEL